MSLGSTELLTPKPIGPVFFGCLLKISLDSLYLKILDLSKLFVASAPMTPSQSTLKYGSENRP